jgi:hypothetical protein
MKCIMRSILLFSGLSLFAAISVVTYEPEVIEMAGRLDLQTFPGPPNFESIKGGDAIERHFYLKLNNPVDVLPKGGHPSVDNTEPETNVRVIQLAIDGDDKTLWSRFRRIGEGGHVKITGTLFHRFTGHHHSRILLNVQKMEELRRRK